MATAKLDFTNFKEKDKQVIFVGKYMESYIPAEYFDNKMGRFIDDKIEALGIFLFRIYKNEDKKDKAEMHTMKLPVLMVTKPSSYKKNKLTINGTTRDFYVCQYYQNDIFIDNTVIVQSSTMACDYINYFHNGKIPNFVSYDDALFMEINTVLINKLKFPIPSTMLETICSEINRDANDISKPFRFAAAEGANPRAYTPVSIKQLPSFNSTFTSVTFEDIDYQLTSSVNKTRYNKPEKISPLEKTIKY